MMEDEWTERDLNNWMNEIRAKRQPCRYSEGKVMTRRECGCSSCQLDLAEGAS